MVGDRVYIVTSEIVDNSTLLSAGVDGVFISKDNAHKYIADSWASVDYTYEPELESYCYDSGSRIKIFRTIEEHTIQGGENEK